MLINTVNRNLFETLIRQIEVTVGGNIGCGTEWKNSDRGSYEFEVPHRKYLDCHVATRS
jgi:hypothetical protein